MGKKGEKGLFFFKTSFFTLLFRLFLPVIQENEAR